MSEHDSYFVSARSNEAATHYRNGVRMLMAGTGDAEVPLHNAMNADPGFGPALAAYALLLATRGDCGGSHRFAKLACRLTTGITRRERQHVEVITLVVTGSRSRARALAREHLQEFPTDDVVQFALDWSDPR